MKKVFALLLVFVMLLSAVPVLAEENPQIESVVLFNDNAPRPRVSTIYKIFLKSIKAQ